MQRARLQLDEVPVDRFGRVIDNLYKYSPPPADVDRVKDGHDRASNRLWRKNTVSRALDTPKYFGAGRRDTVRRRKVVNESVVRGKT